MADDKYAGEMLPVLEAAQPPAKKEEGDADRSDRRKRELASAVDAHMEEIAQANKVFPTPSIPFAAMSDSDKRKAREKLRLIIQANRKYHTTVRATCARHRAEDTKLRADKEALRAKEAA